MTEQEGKIKRDNFFNYLDEFIKKQEKSFYRFPFQIQIISYNIVRFRIYRL